MIPPFPHRSKSTRSRVIWRLMSCAFGFNPAEDWAGRPALLFRVILSDEASHREPLSGDHQSSAREDLQRLSARGVGPSCIREVSQRERTSQPARPEVGIAGDLLRQAEHLAAYEGPNPSQASLRRSVSTRTTPFFICLWKRPHCAGMVRRSANRDGARVSTPRHEQHVITIPETTLGGIGTVTTSPYLRLSGRSPTRCRSATGSSQGGL